MKKKGDTQIEPIVVITIAITVLALVGFGWYMYYNNQLNFFKFIPDFNMSKDKNQDIEIIRYGLDYLRNDGVDESLSVSYYDGDNWIEFEKDGNGKFKSVIIGDKEVNYYDLKEDIGKYYFSWEGADFYDPRYFEVGIRKSKVEIDEGIPPIEIIGYAFGKVNDKYLGISFKQRDFNYIFSSSGKLLSYDQNLDLYEVDKNKNPSLYENYGERISKWERDIFEYSASIRYKDAKTKDDEQNWYCVKKIGNYLIVDLTKPVNEDTKCLIDIR